MTSAPTIINPGKIVKTLREHLRLWAIPAVVIALCALGYAIVRPAKWKASQALLVRDEAAGALNRKGRFDSPDSMKAAVETILEIARSRAVVAAALKQLGPPSGTTANGDWPTPADIEKGQAAIAVEAPKGAEFGRTEVIYLSATARTPADAIALNKAVCDQTESRLRQLRQSKAKSIIAELERAVALAQTDLDAATRQLEAMETDVGSDLGELRTLNEAGAGDSNLRTTLNQIKEELRRARTVHEANLQQRQHLLAAKDDPDQLVATPNRVLESQPSLRRLKDGLVDAQLRTAEILGKMSTNHPVAQAAIAAENQVRVDLHNELEVALRGLSADLKVTGALAESLEGQLADVSRRLSRLATIRARYANLVAEVRHRGELVAAARKDLADARASQSAASSGSLISRLDRPETGDSPVGPGRTMIVLCGMVGGLSAGFGLVFLAAPLSNLRGRRWSDYLGVGRRTTDTASRREENARPIVSAPDQPQSDDRRQADRRSR